MLDVRNAGRIGVAERPMRDQVIMFLATNIMFMVLTNAASLICGAARKRYARVAARAPSIR
jgi:hypothetical protein